MSENERKELSRKIVDCIRAAQWKLYERKAKLGEPVVVADANGLPMEISGQEALNRALSTLSKEEVDRMQRYL